MTTKTAFQAIEEVLKSATPETTIKDVRTKANVSNGAVLAYLKRKKVTKM